MEKQVLVSIVVVNFNAARYIQPCINSIFAASFRNWELIIVDDGSTDESLKILQSYQKHPAVRVVFLTKNHGAAQARNLGAKQTTGKYLFFLDIDTVIHPTCLEKIVSSFRKDENIGALQLQLIKGNSGSVETVGHFLTPTGFPYEVTKVACLDKEKTIFGARSAAIGVRKDLFDRVGGFDGDYRIYGEDTDLSWRVWLLGYRVVLLPQAKVYHFAKSSLSPKTDYRVFYEGAKNNTCNLLKNASINTLLWMLPLHILGWILVSLRLVLQRRFNMAMWVYKGLWWNVINLPKTLAKRRYIQRLARSTGRLGKIMFGPLSKRELLGKGIRWLKQI